MTTRRIPTRALLFVLLFGVLAAYGGQSPNPDTQIDTQTSMPTAQNNQSGQPVVEVGPQGNPGTTQALFYVKFFMNGDESFTVTAAMPLSSDIIDQFSVTVDYMQPDDFMLTSFTGNDQSTMFGRVCREGCPIKVDTSLFPRELFPDTTGDYFFFATGWGNQPQFAFPMGWAPQP